ncbi:MAG TPA: ATP-dependent helicase HrpB [Polyangiales bacterium]|nr:ATP-dependent helicase HrpB [Polyangiales bacterium]
MQPLPIDAHLPALIASLREHPNLILSAEPGAGKTTRVPRALLDANFAEQGEILVLEPRRIATRMAARRVAEELDEQVGQRIGYQVRFESVASPRTRVRFVTEGILSRRLVADPRLRDVAVVVLDEFHERSIHGDVGLALLRRLQRGPRPDLKLVVMSATLDAEALARFLDAPVMQVPGRPYPVSIEYAERPSDTPLEQRVAAAVRRALAAGATGDMLVFLPGAAEIRRAAEACQNVAGDAKLEIALLHGDLPARDQDRAVTRGAQRKLILSTNVAETSLTIDGVDVVIDSGLARAAGHSPFSGLPTLSTQPISRASAQQRAGRAGRTGPGRCLRLYTKHDHDQRPEHDLPELLRADLAETLLDVAASGGQLEASDWLDPPPTAAWNAARELLSGLGALDPAGALTELGRRLAALPLHPRLSRLALDAQQRGAGASGCLLAALLSERDVLVSARTRFDAARGGGESGRSDLVHRLELIEAAAGRLRAYDLDPGAVSAARRTQERLIRMLDAFDDHGLDDDAREQALQNAILVAFFDRVARRRTRQGKELVFARGGSATQAESSVVRDAEYLVVVDAQERKHGAQRGVVAQLCSAIEPEWLLELFPDRIVDRTDLTFDPKTERVQSQQTLSYDGLVLDSVVRSDVSGPEVAEVLARAATEAGLQSFVDLGKLAELRERLAFAASVDASLKPLDDAALQRALLLACEGKRSFAELRADALLEYVFAELPEGARSKLARFAPENIDLPHGRRLRVHYERDKPPWVQSRLQDFFGLRESPRIGDRALVLHLLAPNQRAVQVTSDLAGFWSKHYPDLRRELMRRYPRHAWPEDPLHAQPSGPRKR